MTFLNVVEIESALIALNNAYPGLTELILLPNPTAEGRRSHALVIHANTTYDCRPALIFVSGVHAREWGGPDTLVNLAADLLEAYTTGSGLTYGGRSFTATEIVNLVDRTDVVVFPDQNPDGRAYSMAAAPGSQQSMWRKNRNTASSSGNPARIGVDINRNYDFLWDYTTAFHPNVSPASNNPGSDTYHGTGPFSEPETRNAQWLVDRFPRAAYFVDVHSYSGLVLYPWGDDEDQTTDPAINFQNGTWNGQRGLRNDAYRDYVPPARLPQLQTAAGRAPRRDPGRPRPELCPPAGVRPVSDLGHERRLGVHPRVPRLQPAHRARDRVQQAADVLPDVDRDGRADQGRRRRARRAVRPRDPESLGGDHLLDPGLVLRRVEAAVAVGPVGTVRPVGPRPGRDQPDHRGDRVGRRPGGQVDRRDRVGRR